MSVLARSPHPQQLTHLWIGARERALNALETRCRFRCRGRRWDNSHFGRRVITNWLQWTAAPCGIVVVRRDGAALVSVRRDGAAPWTASEGSASASDLNAMRHAALESTAPPPWPSSEHGDPG